MLMGFDWSIGSIYQYLGYLGIPWLPWHTLVTLAYLSSQNYLLWSAQGWGRSIFWVVIPRHSNSHLLRRRYDWTPKLYQSNTFSGGMTGCLGILYEFLFQNSRFYQNNSKFLGSIWMSRIVFWCSQVIFDDRKLMTKLTQRHRVRHARFKHDNETQSQHPNQSQNLSKSNHGFLVQLKFPIKA